MAFNPPHSPQRRSAALALLRDSDLTMRAIAERLGLSYNTLRAWNQESGLRPAAMRPAASQPDTWSLVRRRAIGRLLARGDLDVGDLAVAAGLGRGGAANLILVCGGTEEASPGADPPEPATGPAQGPSLDALDAALRGHVGRQIARFDAQLRLGDGGSDSARVLRDLGGLKRLLDDLAERGGPGTRPGERLDGRTDGTGASGEAADGGDDDLPALRAELARRYAAFLGERDDAGLPGGAATAPPEGAGG